MEDSRKEEKGHGNENEKELAGKETEEKKEIEEAKENEEAKEIEEGREIEEGKEPAGDEISWNRGSEINSINEEQHSVHMSSTEQGFVRYFYRSQSWQSTSHQEDRDFCDTFKSQEEPDLMSGENYDIIEGKTNIGIINNYPYRGMGERGTRLMEIINSRNEHYHALFMEHDNLDYDKLSKCDAFILTGSSYNVSQFKFHPCVIQDFEPVISIIRGWKSKPILGICYGLHLIARAFNIEVGRMQIPSPGNQIINISLKEPDELVSEKDLAVNVFHRDYIDPNEPGLSQVFEVKAVHDYHGYETVQYMKHKFRPVYAIQFHPETHDVNFCYKHPYDLAEIQKARLIGEEIIYNFLEVVSNESMKELGKKRG